GKWDRRAVASLPGHAGGVWGPPAYRLGRARRDADAISGQEETHPARGWVEVGFPAKMTVIRFAQRRPEGKRWRERAKPGLRVCLRRAPRELHFPKLPRSFALTCRMVFFWLATSRSLGPSRAFSRSWSRPCGNWLA